eukprot:gene7695-860_t
MRVAVLQEYSGRSTQVGYGSPEEMHWNLPPPRLLHTCAAKEEVIADKAGEISVLAVAASGVYCVSCLRGPTAPMRELRSTDAQSKKMLPLRALAPKALKLRPRKC